MYVAELRSKLKDKELKRSAEQARDAITRTFKVGGEAGRVVAPQLLSSASP